jgi:hypothetical protein
MQHKNSVFNRTERKGKNLENCRVLLVPSIPERNETKHLLITDKT